MLDEVESIDRQILAAKTRRNTFVPISKLPPEILGDIFEYQVYVPAYPTYTARGLHTPSLWPAIMLVCKYWRDVAVHHHVLWTSLTDKNIRQWPMFIERPHSKPLNIHIYHNKEDTTVPLLAALAELHRIRLMNLRVKHSVMEEVVLMLNASAPNLRELHLDVFHGVTGYYGEATTGHWITSLRKDFVSESAPNLQRISLSGVCFPWGACAFNMRTLRLGFSSTPRGLTMALTMTAVPSSDVFHSLTHSSLEFLAILEMSVIAISDRSMSMAPVALPSRLKHPRIEKAPADLYLPIWLSTPQLDAVYLELDALPTGFSMSQLQDFVRRAESHLSHHSSKVRRLIARYADKPRIESDVMEFVMPSPTNFEVDRDALVAHIVLLASFENLTRLELGDRLELPDQVLKVITTRSKLTELTLSAGAQTIAKLLVILGSHISEIVKRKNDPGFDASAIQPALPRLQSLTLAHTDFTWLASRGTQLSLCMEMVLKTRLKHKASAGPKKLEIKECDVTQEMVRSWMIDRCVDVYWDGHTGHCPSPPPPSPRGPMLWDSENKEYYEAEIGPDVWQPNPDIPI